MKHTNYLLPIQTVHRLLQEIGFSNGGESEQNSGIETHPRIETISSNQR
jgi:hypothetical protein